MTDENNSNVYLVQSIRLANYEEQLRSRIATHILKYRFQKKNKKLWTL